MKQAVRRAGMLLAAWALVAGAATQATAQEIDPAFGNVQGDVAPAPVDAAPANAAPSVVGDGTASSPAPAPAAARPRSTCTRKGGTRVCRRYSAAGRLQWTCTTRRRTRTCRYFATSGRLTKTCTRTPRRSRCVRPKRRAELGRVPWETSTASTPASVASRSIRSAYRYDGGYVANPIAAVVRFWKWDAATGKWIGWCSGTMIRRGLVLTAAHCIYYNNVDGPKTGERGYIPTNQLMVTPGNTVDANGGATAPYGNWGVANMWVTQDYANDNIGRDWAIVQLQPNASGQFAGDLTGTYAAIANARFASGERLFRVGYPASGPFNTAPYFFGNRQYYCDMVWDGSHWDTGGQFGIYTEPCEMNGGCSGGPVFAYFPSEQQWMIVGVNNRGRSRNDGFGADGTSYYFDNNFLAFWNAVLPQVS
ncbi:MAG: trypsin-like peptidase domain-containing protein [Thermoleophilia bacterium]|nr:trypsin-like peptidase domain-containing protein [Thermoleophilia bacterium]